MMIRWREKKLGDVAKFIDYRGKTPRKTVSGIPLITAKIVKNGSILPPNEFIAESDYDAWMTRGLPKTGDVVLTTEAPLGEVAQLKDSHVALAQRIIVLRAKEDVLDNTFLKYFLLSAEGQARLKSRESGTTVTGIKSSELQEVLVPIPELPTQKRIARILSSLDDKIEVNNQINRNLEEQAKAIFKSWFVDFEPFKGRKFVDSELGKIPKGWKISSLSSIAVFLNGLAMQKFRPEEDDSGLPVLKIKELHQGYCDTNSDSCSSEIPEQYIIHDGDVVFSWSGTLLVDFWCGGECGLNQHLFKVTSEKFDKWFYFLWISHHLAEFSAIAEGKATTMGHIKREHLDQAKVLLPSASDYNALSSILKPVYDQIVLNKIESKKLALLRDTLLPKLMTEDNPFFGEK